MMPGTRNISLHRGLIMEQYDIFESTQNNQFDCVQENQLNDVEQDYIINLALAILTHRHTPGRSLTKPEDTAHYLQMLLAENKREVFGVLFLDNQHHILSFEKLFFGTIDSASVYPRIIVQRGLELNTAAVIAVHNHPSGLTEPSHADKQITQKIKEALALVDVRLLDHFIVTTLGTYSFAEHGLI